MGKPLVQTMKHLVPPVASLLALLVLAAACSGGEQNNVPAETTGYREGTLSGSGSTGESTASRGFREGTLGERPAATEVMLRLEGDPESEFSGICTIAAETNVIAGRVPKRYLFDVEAQGLSCEIEKQDPGDGSLRVILLSGDSTLSVQQVEAPGGTISVSYSGG